MKYRWKREALHEIKHEDLGRPGRLSSLWMYGAGHIQGGADALPDGWLHCVFPSETESNGSRWPLHPAWLRVQSAFTTETAPACLASGGTDPAPALWHQYSAPLAAGWRPGLVDRWRRCRKYLRI